VTSYPVVEHGTSRSSRWLRERRLKLALAIGVLESILVLSNAVGWFWILGAAIVAFVVYFWVRANVRNETARQIAWTVAFSQVLPFLVPLLWGLVKLVAILLLVVAGLVAVALLLLDRR
jgi:hypothetical protein